MNYKKTLGLSLIFMPAFVLGNPSSPEQIYNTAGGYGCSTCHGKYAHGGGFVGGNIRGATRDQLDNALETEPTMLLLAKILDENKRNSLVDYLATLSEMQLLEWRIGESATTTVMNAKAGKRIQLVLFNSTFKTLSFDFSSIDSLKNYQIEAYDTKAITWISKVGRYSFYAENEHFIIDIN